MNVIAVVDDEKNIREMIRFALERENYTVEEYSNGEEAWESLRIQLPQKHPHLIILDITMPRMDGMELCRHIRGVSPETPIIFLSSRDEEIDRVLGLESGGDDYVCKPFGMRELLARIRAALRRSGREEFPAAGSPVSGEKTGVFPFLRGSLSMDEARHLVLWKEKPVDLTLTEFRILRLLAENPGYVKTREQLMQAAFPDDSFPNDRAADSHIKRIRKKLLCADPQFENLETIYGLGYRFKEPR